MDDLYREIILEHYKHPLNFGFLPKPTHRHEGLNPMCGDQIIIELSISENKKGDRIIKDIRFQGVGCAISLASASILTEELKGKKIEYLKGFTKDAMVKLLGVSLTPARLKCALLALETAQKAAGGE